MKFALRFGLKLKTETFIVSSRTLSNKASTFKETVKHHNAFGFKNNSYKNSATSHEVQESHMNYNWLRKSAPFFKVNGNQIEVIEGPVQFYHKLKKLTNKAQKRIVLATLYLGTGNLEKELVSCLKNSLAQKSELSLRMVLDKQRGTRGQENSITLLLPLKQKHNVSVHLFQSPNFKNWHGKVLSERFNEVVGLFHIKAYIFDNDLIISGANLSDTYFTNRQDRYVLIKNCKGIADYYDRLITELGKFSFTLNNEGELVYCGAEGTNPNESEQSNKNFKKCLKEAVERLIKPNNVDLDESTDEDLDTVIYPLVQIGPVGISQDSEVTEEMLGSINEEQTAYLASGYFNLTDIYSDLLLFKSQASFHIITSAPQANSFYNSAGLSYYIPATYTCIMSNFMRQVFQQQACTNESQQQSVGKDPSNQNNRVFMYEYDRPDWSIHAKGIWLYNQKGHDSNINRVENTENLPFLTMIGSPNYGYRSVFKDLESQIVIITRNLHLKYQLHKERLNIYKHSYRVDEQVLSVEEATVPLWVRLLAPRLKNYF